jgi:hypothetical protein
MSSWITSAISFLPEDFSFSFSLMRWIQVLCLPIWVSCFVKALQSVQQYLALGLWCSSSPYIFNPEDISSAMQCKKITDRLCGVRICCPVLTNHVHIVSECMVLVVLIFKCFTLCALLEDRSVLATPCLLLELSVLATFFALQWWQLAASCRSSHVS